MQDGYPILKAQWWAKDATEQELLHVFRSDAEEEMPMAKERIRVMREDGGALLQVSCSAHRVAHRVVQHTSTDAVRQ